METNTKKLGKRFGSFSFGAVPLSELMQKMKPEDKIMVSRLQLTKLGLNFQAMKANDIAKDIGLISKGDGKRGRKPKIALSQVGLETQASSIVIQSVDLDAEEINSKS
jgi:hypothetical protein